MQYMGYCFFLSAIIHRKVIHVNIFIFSAIFSRAQFVDISLPWHCDVTVSPVY